MSEFNKQAADYVKYRPVYPREVYDFLASLTPGHDLAYDAGTGNGQCATPLADYFKEVIASDISQNQIDNAIKKNKVTYLVSEAHETTIKAKTVDLITSATAIHWFNFEMFFAECKRILKPNGIIAAWSYGWHECENEHITKIIQHFGKNLLQDYWRPQPKLIWDNYKSIPFPFEKIKHPEFKQQVQWNLEELIGYLSTWSATQKYINDKKSHPAELVYKELLSQWGDPSIKLEFHSPLIMLVGKHTA